MSRNGSGTYSLPAGNPVVTGTTISSSAFNTTMTDLAAALTASIAKDGQTTPTANLPMGGYKLTGLGAGSAAGNSLRYEQLFTTSAVQLLGAMDWVKGADIASAATVNLTTATGNGVHITGTTTITAVTLGTGMLRLVVFDGALTLTHHATNNNLPSAANITTAAGDRAIYWADGTTVYCVGYFPAAGNARFNVAQTFSALQSFSAGVQVTGAALLGYGTGAGGTVVQGTSQTTAVTINKPCGAITMFSAAGTTTWQSFTVNNSVVSETDTVIVTPQAAGAGNAYVFVAERVAAGSFRINFSAVSGTTSEGPIINFTVIKGVTS